MMVLRLLFAMAILFIPTIALSHGSGQHVLGTVTAIDEKHIEVKTPKGPTVTVQLTKQTRFKEKGNPKSTEPPAVGDRVVIEATKDANVLIATEVHYSAAKNAPAAAR
jgi:putative ribosome biogenesis GTPase RsgA